MPTLPPAIKKLISIAFFAGLVFLGARTCSVESADCELVFVIEPPAGVTLKELEVRLYERKGTELVGQFRKYYRGQGPSARWPLAVREGTYRLEGELHTDSKVVSFEREIELEDGEASSVHLSRLLAADE